MLHGEGPEVVFLARSKKSGDWLRSDDAGAARTIGSKASSRPVRGTGAEPVARLSSDAAVAAETGRFLKRASEGASSPASPSSPGMATFFLEAYGRADRDFDVPNRTDTKFNVGSINKVFTQVAVAQLASGGKLALSDRPRLPDYPGPGADRITIQQLLTMSSGLGDIFGKKYDATPKSRLRNLSDFLPLFVDEPLLFEPGMSRRYSNAGYVVLGLIVERVSGQSYHDYVREHVFRPAGMRLRRVSPGRGVAELRRRYTRVPRPRPLEARAGCRGARRAGPVVAEERPYLHPVGHCYRCHTRDRTLALRPAVVRPRRPAEGPAKEAARSGADHVPARRWIHVHEWLDGLRDWNISRQLWWGHRIPVWYCADGHETCAVEDPDACGDVRLDRARAGPRRPGHVVLVPAVAVLDARLAGRDRRPGVLPPDVPAGHRLRDPLPLGRPDDHERDVPDRRRAVPRRRDQRAGARPAGPEDVEVARQRRSTRST